MAAKRTTIDGALRRACNTMPFVLGILVILLQCGCSPDHRATEDMVLDAYPEFRSTDHESAFDRVYRDEDRNLLVCRYVFKSASAASNYFTSVRTALETNRWSLTMIAPNHGEAKRNRERGDRVVANFIQVSNKVAFGTMWFPAPQYENSKWEESNPRWIDEVVLPKIRGALN